MIEHLILDGKSGIYPQQANGPVQVTESYTEHLGNFHQEGKPYADFDLRIESQIGESYILTQAWEAFHPEIDVTSIDFKKHVTEIHQPDGKNDILQQIENGALTVVNGYLAPGLPVS